ncbi:GIY-YIG nuclease family protein [Vibrio alginolyticus]|uniref:GIY-YIG nuclease family protein n=1 Tax=Vibrio alginolyticus TaxID=663 RepID=UPI00374A4539
MSTWRTNYRNATIFYVAYSESLKIVKIGITKNLEQRIKILNIHLLGGADNFELVSSAQLDKEAGPFETLMLRRLQQYVQHIDFEGKSEDTTSKEALDVSIETVIKTGAQLLFNQNRSAFYQFISCVDYHRRNLWSSSETTLNLRKIRAQHPLQMRTTKLAEYL